MYLASRNALWGTSSILCGYTVRPFSVRIDCLCCQSTIIKTVSHNTWKARRERQSPGQVNRWLTVAHSLIGICARPPIASDAYTPEPKMRRTVWMEIVHNSSRRERAQRHRGMRSKMRATVLSPLVPMDEIKLIEMTESMGFDGIYFVQKWYVRARTRVLAHDTDSLELTWRGMPHRQTKENSHRFFFSVYCFLIVFCPSPGMERMRARRDRLIRLQMLFVWAVIVNSIR